MNHTCWKVSDTWHGGRENLIFRPEPGVPPRLDDPRYSSYQFDGDTIPGTGRDSSFVVLRALIGGECYCWRNGKIRINKDSGDPVISFQRFSRMIGSRKAEFLKISSKSRNLQLRIIAMKFALCKKFHFPLGHSRGRGACFDLRAAECLHRASHLQSQFNWARCTDSLRPPLWATPDITHA